MSTYVTYLPSTSLTLPSQAGQAGKYLYTDGTSLSWATPVTQTITSGVTATSPSENAVYSALAAKVAGPAAAADLNIAIFDGVTGKLIKDSVGWSISSGNLLSTADGTYNIGAPSTSRPGRVYAKTAINLDSLTINTILGSDASRNVVSLDTAVYPSLVELSYVKGVTSSIQTQLNGKQASGNYITALTSDVTASGPGSAAATISNNVVTNAKLFQMVNNTIKGNVSGSTGAPSDLTGTQVTTLLDTFTSSLKGLTPASGGGTTNFLRADGTWAAVGGLPSQTGNADKVLVTDGTNSSWQYAGLGSGSFPANTVILGRGLPAGLTSTKGVLIGVGATVINNGIDAVSVGYNASSDAQCVAVGSSSRSYYNGYEPSVAVGYNSYATGEASVAIGGSCTANRNSTVIGKAASDAGQGIAIGRDAINSAQAAIAIGREAATAQGGAIAIGHQAKGGTSAASYQLVIGYQSGSSNNSGVNNTVVGSASFNNASLTTAYDCTIVGKGAGTTLTTGFSCVLVGSGATCGATNEDAIAIGNNATGANFGIAIGKGNTTSSEGVTIGSAGRAGSESVSVGRYAGYYNNGSQSVAIGVRSNAGNTLGTTVGYRAGGVSFSGTYTNGTHIGAYSGNALTTGSSNVFLGYYSGGRSTTQNNELFIDNQDRTTYAAQQTGSILYGVMSATASSQTLTTNSAFTATYGLNVSTVGYGLSVKGGSNAKIGKATFSGVSSVTVSTTAVTANSIILVTNQSGGYAPMCVNNIVAGTSFDIQHNNSFTGTVAWIIVEIVP